MYKRQLETLCDLDLLIGKYEEAISLEEKAVATIEQSAGPDSHDLAPRLVRLAGTYRAGSQTPKAEPVLLLSLIHIYDSLQAKITKRYSYGLSAQAAYTFSKELATGQAINDCLLYTSRCV